MRRKFLNAVIYGAVLTATVGSFSSCKDYDSDIDSLKQQLDQKASKEELKSEVAKLQASIDAAKKEAADRAADLQKQIDALKSNTGSSATPADIAAVNAEIAKLQAEQKTQNDRLAKLDALEKTVSGLSAQVDKAVTAEDLKAIQVKVDEATNSLSAIVGHRLTSIALIPENHINGIQAVTFYSLAYKPVAFRGAWTNGERITVDAVDLAKDTVTIGTDKNMAKFVVSPRAGVRKQDVGMPLFDNFRSANEMSRADVFTENSPLKVTDFNIDNGVMTVMYKKSVPGRLRETYANGREEFQMVSLRVPIAEANLSAEEKKADTPVYVESEAYRVREKVMIPYILNANTDPREVFTVEDESKLLETNPAGKYIHYSDSTTLYNSTVGQRLDYKFAYNEKVDLKKLVSVCASEHLLANHNVSGHQRIDNYKDYGLTYRFYVATGEYNTLGGPDNNSNKTDQQKFAQIDSPANGILTSKVYTVGGNNQAAVGREPIIRAELRDSVNNNLVAVRYIKVKWVMQAKDQLVTIDMPEKFLMCGGLNDKTTAQQMNELVYSKITEKGVSKEFFHQTYTEFEQVGVKDGTVTQVENSEENVESYVLNWQLTEQDIFSKATKYEPTPLTFEAKVKYSDPTNTYPNVIITLRRTILRPAFDLWGYVNAYWLDGDTHNTYRVNAINPDIVFGSTTIYPEDATWYAGTKANKTANIYTDLLYGYKNQYGVRPDSLARAIYYMKGEMKYNYARAIVNELANVPDYYVEGANFKFDAEKLATKTYPVFDPTTNTVSQQHVTLRNNDTELWIGNQKAAQIHNFHAIPSTKNGNKESFFINLVESRPNADNAAQCEVTEAAKALIGQDVPVMMVGNLCSSNDHSTYATSDMVTIKRYNVNFIRPLTMTVNTDKYFVDAVNEGDTINVKDAAKYMTWNADKNGNYYNASKYMNPVNHLADYYGVEYPQFDFAHIKTNLKDNGTAVVPVEGYKEGRLPQGMQVSYYEDTNYILKFVNNGSPIEREFKLYIPVLLKYKWETKVMTLEVVVKPNAGTTTGR